MDDEENEEDMDDADSEENADDEENESESEEPTVAEEVPTEPATETLDIPVTAALQYASQTNMSGMVKAVTVRESAVESSHVVQRDTTIDNSAWYSLSKPIPIYCPIPSPSTPSCQLVVL